jgi:hypothetical protein
MSVLSNRLIVQFQSSRARSDDARRRLARILLKDIGNDHCVCVQPIDQAPGLSSISDAQFVTPRANDWHRPRMWHGDLLTSLKPSQQCANLVASHG